MRHHCSSTCLAGAASVVARHCLNQATVAQQTRLSCALQLSVVACLCQHCRLASLTSIACLCATRCCCSSLITISHKTGNRDLANAYRHAWTWHSATNIHLERTRKKKTHKKGALTSSQGLVRLQLLCCVCRQNQELEKLNEIIQVEKLRLEQQNTTLAQNLAAVVQEKLVPDAQFNLNTPIDEAISVLQSLIMVSHFCCFSRDWPIAHDMF